MGSTDGIVWNDLECKYTVNNTIYNGNFNFDENYTIEKVPDKINYVKVQFPQEKEYSEILGEGNVCNWQLALRNIAFNAGDYSQLSTKEEKKVEKPVLNKETPKPETKNVSGNYIYIIVGVAIVIAAATGVTVAFLIKRKRKAGK